MINSTKEKAEKAKAIKKLLSKWFRSQATKGKADLLKAKNPELKIVRAPREKKAS